MSIEEKREKLEKQVENSRKDIRADRMDMSFGEIMNMYEEGELIISPEFQRAFRWEKSTQTRFIESLVLGIPIPPIFVAETKKNVWELVDGLQRLSTVLSFFGKLKDKEKNNLILEEASILTELRGFTIDSLPLNYKLLLKRAVCRVEVIRYDSEFDMRYELFNRLNTGGVLLSEQEIRNCIFRPYDNKFNNFIQELSKKEYFTNIIKIRKEDEQRMYAQELVLRFFTLKNFGTTFDKNIQKHMDNYMLKVSKGEINFRYKEEERIFEQTCNILYGLEDNIFKLSTLNFSTSMYDALMINIALNIEKVNKYTADELLDRINSLKKDKGFRKNTNAASSSKYRINSKIEIADKILFD
ncbi:DUF262 domain-containing protein [Clostridium sp. MCC353]|uniref:DUF262 domain-containing protein n=1 Tax=Clostridium sp. MCC353 TaxID=2592646 RepID=UPI001C02CEA9|nr:DUF262 domain-containing protein [Clostridium sp. MCC353]MBT9776657.1 DUF262 domain-containing protein [Clostridium sp. MCC353]